ncbi:calcium-binding protein [Phaeobacter marinintestinus]|uniref:calcium-binding protein n=1 Tax=Falsiphaeobacter marinintestinus TaxID=1492905 RepID=UPI0011B5A219|nr:calcium-binding protein [Phaeobacter marinintestinus]
MTVYVGEVARVDALGNVDVVTLEVNDPNDDRFESEEAGAEFVVDGVSLGPDAPVISFGSIMFLERNGLDDTAPMLQFSDGVYDYYVLSQFHDPNEAIVRLTTTVDGVLPPTFGVDYFPYSFVPEGQIARYGDALRVDIDEFGNPINLTNVTFFAYDDDRFVEFSSETGTAPIGNEPSVSIPHFDLGYSDFATGGTHMTLVDIEYLDAAGVVGTMRVVRVDAEKLNEPIAFYLRSGGGVDLSVVEEVISETAVGLSIEGRTWAQLGLSMESYRREGTDTFDFIEGTFQHDLILGKEGGDMLFGLRGNDRIRGGANDDRLYGGMDGDILLGDHGEDILVGGHGNDTLRGGIGNDELFGGSEDDTLLGETGSDELFGGRGDDELRGGRGADDLHGEQGDDQLGGGEGDDDLFGGLGNDTMTGGLGDDWLRGQAGDDVLDGGDGADLHLGGGGADLFIFYADGETDTILDFEDGVDLITFGAPTASVTITDVEPGHVEIVADGDLLVVKDSDGTLTAADITAEDFL